MSNLERDNGEYSSQISTPKIDVNNTIEILAQINLGRIKWAYLGDEVKTEFELLQQEAEKNPSLEKQIANKYNEILLRPIKKQKSKKFFSKKHKSKVEPCSQPSFWPIEKKENNKIVIEDKPTLEINMDNFAKKKVNSRYGNRWDKDLKEEVRLKKLELREMIGLPVARKGNGRENDKFYKYLVRKIVVWDKFMIFRDYCSETVGVEEGLDCRIREVKNIVDILVSNKYKIPQNKKYQYFWDLLWDYEIKWNLD